RQTELPRLAGDPCLATRNECRHRSEVVRVGRVPKAEQDCNEQDEPDRRPVGESRDPAVQHHSTPGSARVVMARPSTRISAALTAGTARTIRPSKFFLRRKRLALTAASPTAVIAPARPRLNATMRTSP